MTKGIWRQLAVVIALTAIVGVSASVAPAGSPGGARLHIDAEFDSVLDFGGNARCQYPFLLVLGQGTAKGTHLSSHSTATAEECSDDRIRPGFFVVHGMGTFTTPNGDQLFLDYHETSNAPDFSVTPCACVLYDKGTFTVVGGTGRFAEATGSGTISAVVPIFYDAATGLLRAHVTAEYDGTIRFKE